MPGGVDARIFRRIEKIGDGGIQTVAQAGQIAPHRHRPLRLGIGFADDLEPIGYPALSASFQAESSNGGMASTSPSNRPNISS